MNGVTVRHSVGTVGWWPCSERCSKWFVAVNVLYKNSKTKILLENGQDIKMESIRKLSNFNFQWTKTLYQNNLCNIAFFFTFFKGYRILNNYWMRLSMISWIIKAEVCVICRSWRLRQIIQTRGFDNSWHHMKTEFNNCFITDFLNNRQKKTNVCWKMALFQN